MLAITLGFMLTVGLTGGIGAGKSEVSKRLASLGAVLIDSDVVAREVVEPGTAGLDAVVARFGKEILRPDGSLDRPKLASIVFADPDRLAALNAIVHPLVGRRTQELKAVADPDAIVVHAVPLLAENDLASRYDVVVDVDASEQTQLDRLIRLRGMTEDEARSRMAAQAPRQARLALADLVIDNDGPLEELDRQVRSVWAELRARAAVTSSR